MDKLTIKKLNIKNAKEIYKLNQKVWKGNRYIHSLKEIKNRLNDLRYAGFGAYLKKKLIGFMFIDMNLKSTKTRLNFISINQDFQRQGISSAL